MLGPVCESEPPPLQDAGSGHRVACHIPLAELEQLQAGGRVSAS